MTGLLLATLLNLTPGIQLADNVGARHLALSEARFVPLFVTEDERTPRPMFEQMTRDQLVGELRRLDDVRPSLGMPIGLLVAGVLLILPGAPITVAGSIALGVALRGAMTGLAAGASILLGVGAVMLTVGAILAIVGGVNLGLRIRGRTLNGRQADEVRRRLDALENGQPLPAPIPETPSPSQTHFVVPGAMQTVMTF